MITPTGDRSRAGRLRTVPPDTTDQSVNNHKSQIGRDKVSLNETKKAKFHPGQIVATPGALEALQDAGQTAR